MADWMSNRIRAINSSSGMVSFVAGNGAAAYANGAAASSSFNTPFGIAAAADGSIFVGDGNTHTIRKIVANTVTTFAGTGSSGFANGAAPLFNHPQGLCIDALGNIIVADEVNFRLRLLFPNGSAITIAGSGINAEVDGPFPIGAFSNPVAVAPLGDGYAVVDYQGNTVRRVFPNKTTVTLAGNGSQAYADGFRGASRLSRPWGIAVDVVGNMFITDAGNNRIRILSPSGYLSTLAGNGVASSVNGFGTAAGFSNPCGVTLDAAGRIYVSEWGSHLVRKLTCVPCPASFYCLSGAPVTCPAGSSCPLSSINATRCPIGTYSAAGASNCTLCPAGTFTSATGSASCQQCPGGHFCPAGTSSWARLNCGRGNYCPDGSCSPTPCPYHVPPTGGWGALQVQGPAFLVETAHCLNHCFWNFTSGDGMLSKC